MSVDIVLFSTSFAVIVNPLKAVDTTAAGDTFTGYFAAAMAQELDAGRGMELAATAAAISVTAAGASVSIPEREAVEAFMKGRER